MSIYTQTKIKSSFLYKKNGFLVFYQAPTLCVLFNNFSSIINIRNVITLKYLRVNESIFHNYSIIIIIA